MWRFPMRAVILIAMLSIWGSRSAQSQSGRTPNIRQGVWVGVGLGAASTEMDCSTCSNFRFTGPSGYVRLGVTVSRPLLLGVEFDGWRHSSSGIAERIGVASLVALWYPIPSGALYVKFGYGGMSYHADEGGDVLTAKARTPSLGLGYELRVRRNISLVPFVNGLASSSVQQYRNGVPVGNGNDFSLNLVQFGVGATWH
jgi:hypothetical protein